MVPIRHAIATGAALVVLGTTIAGCAVHVEQAGPHTVEHRAVGRFDRVEVHGGVRVVVRRGPTRSLAVAGDAYRVSQLVTRVRAGTLVVAPRDASRTIVLGHSQVRATVATPSLDAVALHGAGDVSVRGVRALRLSVTVDGSGTVAAAGRVGALTGRLNGSGDLSLRELAARDASIHVAGSGDADVSAARALHAAIDGSGRIVYAGAPRVTRRVDGSGEVAAVSR